MTGTRITTARLAQLADELPHRYTSVLPHLERVRVLTGGQLDRLLTDPDTSNDTTGRVRRRIMTRLSGLGLVQMLDRRIGGVRAGSAGHVYTLTTAGHTFLALQRGQSPPGRVRHAPTPSPLFLNHALAVSEIYVQLIEASRSGGFRVAHFQAPAWWPAGEGLYLRPDAYLVLDTGAYKDCWWLEIDRATESLPRLTAKCVDYRDHATHGGTGPDGALPRVLFTAPTQRRADAIRASIDFVTTGDAEMITVTTHQQAANLLVTELHTGPLGTAPKQPWMRSSLGGFGNGQ
jgi:hypothetical protein